VTYNLVDAYFQENNSINFYVSELSSHAVMGISGLLASLVAGLFAYYVSSKRQANLTKEQEKICSQYIIKGLSKYKKAKQTKASMHEDFVLTEGIGSAIVGLFLSAIHLILKGIMAVFSFAAPLIFKGLAIIGIFGLLVATIYKIGPYFIPVIKGFVKYLFNIFTRRNRIKENPNLLESVRSQIRSKNIQIAKSVAAKAESNELKKRAESLIHSLKIT